jgi:hypothetical protein
MQLMRNATTTGIGSTAPVRWVGRSLRSLATRTSCPTCPGRDGFDLVRVEVADLAGLGWSEQRDWRCRRCGTVIRHGA